MQIDGITITTCEKICCECGFNGSTEDTLYADIVDIAKQGVVFPCHMYLKSKTGSENQGTETLKKIKVCRGYVAWFKKFNLIAGLASNYPSRVKLWQELTDQIKDEELEPILDMEELRKIHKGIRDNIYLHRN